jgi:hypothetical protein
MIKKAFISENVIENIPSLKKYEISRLEEIGKITLIFKGEKNSTKYHYAHMSAIHSLHYLSC